MKNKKLYRRIYKKIQSDTNENILALGELEVTFDDMKEVQGILLSLIKMRGIIDKALAGIK